MTSWSGKVSAFPLIVSHGWKKEELQEQEEENELESDKQCVHKQDTNMDNDCDKHNCNILFHKSESEMQMKSRMDRKHLNYKKANQNVYRIKTITFRTYLQTFLAYI
jgi:hypothetical protein